MTDLQSGGLVREVVSTTDGVVQVGGLVREVVRSGSSVGNMVAVNGLVREVVRNTPSTSTSLSLEITLTDATLSAQAALALSGSFIDTLDDAVAAGDSVLALNGTLVATIDDAALLAEGLIELSGSVEVTLNAVSLSTTADLALAGSVVFTLESVTLTAASELQNFALLDTPLDDVELEDAFGGKFGDGQVTVTLNDATVSTVATAVHIAICAVTLANVHLRAAGKVTRPNHPHKVIDQRQHKTTQRSPTISRTTHRTGSRLKHHT